MRVVAVMTSAAAGAGAVVGFLFGASLSWLPVIGWQPRAWMAVMLVVCAATTDAVWLATGRPRPWSINRQVPREWSALFSAPVTAALYGARLGVGPFTILSTWLWWAATVGAALTSVTASVLVGGSFGLVRILSTLATSMWAEGPAHQRRFQQLRTAETSSRLTLMGIAIAAGLLLGACTDGSRPEFANDQPDASTARNPRVQEIEEAPPVTEPEPTRITRPVTAPRSKPLQPQDSSDPEVATAPTQPTDGQAPGADGVAVEEPATASPPVNPLASSLMQEVSGFDTIADPSADRALDIHSAADIQPDPTEELPLLETRGFSGGWTRAFRNTERDVMVATVYAFADHEQAAFYLEDGLITIGGYGGQFFEIPDIEGSRGFRQEIGGDEPLLSVGVTFARANRWYLVYLIGDAETLDPELLIAAAREQAALAG